MPIISFDADSGYFSYQKHFKMKEYQCSESLYHKQHCVWSLQKVLLSDQAFDETGRKDLL